jgi:hypothetical protein
MPAIFISHSSLDQRVAGEIKSELSKLGFERVFLAFDKDSGIGADDPFRPRCAFAHAACAQPAPRQVPREGRTYRCHLAYGRMAETEAPA